MLRLHDMAKADASYQASSPRTEISFGPSVWLVFTDQVPHAALGGRNALEQTFYPRSVPSVIPSWHRSACWNG